MKKAMLGTISLVLIMALGGVAPANADFNQIPHLDYIVSQETFIPPEQSRTGPTPPKEVVERDLLRSSLPPEQGGGEILLNNVPSYAWRHGCGPTALGMVVGFYDNSGFPDLIPGDANLQTEAVDQAIASGGDIGNHQSPGSEEHFENYAFPIDNFSTGLLDDDYITSGRQSHIDNSLADYMDTSKSTRNNYYGWSWSNDMGPAFFSYVRQMNDSYFPSSQEYLVANGSMTWSVLTNEIDAGRPMVFLVDSSGNGNTDHFVTVIGYRTSPSIQYAVWDTWSTTVVRWEDFAAMAPGVPWGINRGWTFNIKQPTFNCSETDVSEAECEALVSLYYSTKGDGWMNNSNWLESSLVSDWFGVEVEANNVIGLYLNYNNLSGFLPSQLGNLVELRRLHLESNQLSGSLPPQLGNMGKLEIIFLSGNQFTNSIPSELGNLGNLRWLHLNMNQLSGEIPSALGNLSSLYWLNLWGNQLSGQIPSTLGSIPNLERIELGFNNLSGSIPSEIGNLTNLEILILRNNLFSGDIPESFTDLDNLCTPSDPCSSFMFSGNYGLDLGYNRLNVPATTAELVSFLEEKDPDWFLSQAIFQTIDQGGGEIISYKGDVAISVPEDSVTSETEFYFHPQMYPYNIPSQLRYAGSSFQLTAINITTSEPINTFEPSLVITLFYDESVLGNIAEDSLALYYFDYWEWGWFDVVTTCPDGEYTRDFEQKWFSVPVCHLSEFAVLGEEIPLDELTIYLPLVMK